MNGASFVDNHDLLHGTKIISGFDSFIVIGPTYNDSKDQQLSTDNAANKGNLNTVNVMFLLDWCQVLLSDSFQ
jgi:hypothetical protein